MAELRSMRQAYGKALVELGAANPNVVVLDADVSASTQTWMFREKYPDRFFNVGVAEANMVDVLRAGAAGLGFVKPLFVPADMAARNFMAIEKRAATISRCLANHLGCR